jgi:hypothetical protein
VGGAAKSCSYGQLHKEIYNPYYILGLKWMLNLERQGEESRL